MSSIMTNTAALTALQSLNATNKSLQDTQARISTGYRVSQASDNAAYWSIATTMRSDNQAMSTVSDALGLGASKVDTAYTGMNNAIDTVNQIKNKLVASYGQTDADKQKTQTEIAALQKQLKAYADGATFSGTNMLSVSNASGTAADVKIVSAFNRDASGQSSISTIDVDVESTKLFDSGTAANLKNAGILDRSTAIYSSATAQNAYETAMASSLAGGATDTVAKGLAATAATTADGTATVAVTKSVFDLTDHDW
jgi:flagellin